MSCNGTGLNDFKCDCPKGQFFSYDYGCQAPYNSCSQSHCAKGAKCVPTGSHFGQYKCICPVGTRLNYLKHKCIALPKPKGKPHQVWKQCPGTLKWIGSGPAGVWGVNRSNHIYCRLNTHEAPDDFGKSWKSFAGLLKQISSGKDQVWGVNKGDYIYYRKGISASHPTGTGWVHIAGRLKQVSVSSVDNAVWGVNSHNYIYRRTGTSKKTGGTGWQRIAGTLADVSVGEAGVWGVNRNGYICYRTGTGAHDGNSKKGHGWKLVPGRLTTISVGDGVVYGTNKSKHIYVRYGISSQNPTGTHWKQLSGTLKQISVDTKAKTVWGVNRYT